MSKIEIDKETAISMVAESVCDKIKFCESMRNSNPARLKIDTDDIKDTITETQRIINVIKKSYSLYNITGNTNEKVTEEVKEMCDKGYTPLTKVYENPIMPKLKNQIVFKAS